MKALLIGLLLLGTAFSALMQSTSQGSLRGQNSAHVLRKSNLGRALMQMVQMYTKQDGNTTENVVSRPNADKLFDAIDTLKESIKDKYKAEQDDFAEDQTTHDASVEKYDEDITKYESQVIIFQDELATLNTQKEELATSLLNQQGQLEATQKQLEVEKEFLATLEKKYKEDFANYDQAIQLISEATIHLLEAQQTKQSAFSSFVQVRKNRFQEIAILLESNIHHLPGSQRLYIDSLTSVFTSLMNGQEQDPDTLADAIEALNELRVYFQDGQTLLTSDYEAQEQQHLAVAETLKETADKLFDEIIPTTESDIQTNEDLITAKQAEIDDANSNLKTEQDNLAQENESWGKRVELHQLLIPELELEYQIVVQTENVLRSAYGEPLETQTTVEETDSESGEAESGEAESGEAESEPSESEDAESEPTESKPTESEPTESEPTESEPTESEPAAAYI